MQRRLPTVESRADQHMMEGDSVDEDAFRMDFIKRASVHYVMVQWGKWVLYMVMMYTVVMLWQLQAMFPFSSHQSPLLCDGGHSVFLTREGVLVKHGGWWRRHLYRMKKGRSAARGNDQ
jgi:hypothetical protein